jgi:hypothetical protein
MRWADRRRVLIAPPRQGLNRATSSRGVIANYVQVVEEMRRTRKVLWTAGVRWDGRLCGVAKALLVWSWSSWSSVSGDVSLQPTKSKMTGAGGSKGDLRFGPL